MGPVRLLWVATKPARPAIDGGRALMAATLEALAAQGVEVTFVAPKNRSLPWEGISGVRLHLVEDRAPRPWMHAGWHSLRSGRPLGIERHASAAVTRAVEALTRDERFDIVHVEQVQAWSNALPAIRTGLPSVVRAQNVESDAWAAAAAHRGARRPLRRALSHGLMGRDARRFQRFEAAALVHADATIALSHQDAAKLAALAPSARIAIVPPIAPAEWREEDAVGASRARLTGDPACVWIGSAGWWPNDGARRWLLDAIWPAIVARVPGARLHLFGRTAREAQTHAAAGSEAAAGAGAGAGATIAEHALPDDSRAAFPPGAMLLLPLRAASGVRMRMLEAWARGVPAIASPAAVEGLDAVDGRDVLVAADPRAFAEAAARLAADPALRARLVDGGRATLARHHDPATIARATIAIYREAIARVRTKNKMSISPVGGK